MKYDTLPLCQGCGISHEGPQDAACPVILTYRDGSEETGAQAYSRRGPIEKTQPVLQ